MYYVIQRVWNGHMHTMRTAPYCEGGFSTKGKARYRANQLQECSVVKAGNVGTFIERYERRAN